MPMDFEERTDNFRQALKLLRNPPSYFPIELAVCHVSSLIGLQEGILVNPAMPMDEDQQVRDAATIVLVRDAEDGPRILLGQRGQHAVFMPNKYVFPGGRVDESDAQVALVDRPAPECLHRLAIRAPEGIVEPLLACAIRELWEETGLRLARKEDRTRGPVPANWRSFCAGGYRPSASGLAFLYRAITPPGRTRRFDARFLVGLIDRISLAGDPDDFGDASDELRHLHWVPLSEAQRLDLPSITRLVLATLEDFLAGNSLPDAVPFRYTENGRHMIEHI